MMRIVGLVMVMLGFSLRAESVDYVTDVLPIMKERCWKCHSNENQVKGSVALDDFDEVRDYQIGKFNIIRPGDPDESNFLERLKLESSHTDFMPRKAEPIPKSEIDVIESWIRQGAVVDAKNPAEDEKPWVEKMGSSSGSENAADYVTWTSSDGKDIEARFHSMSGDAVKIVMRDGRSFAIPLSRLNPESVALAKRYAGGQSAR
tara:strand:+ start:259 stop:870 length:612 start_codon:yes stop_codon:yes gene_type:complete